jgi:hypothetical protein
MSDEAWYKPISNGTIEQGDLFFKVNIIVPAIPSEEDDTDEDKDQLVPFRDLFDVIILTQTCDIENAKVEYILVCPHTSFIEAIDQKLTGKSLINFEYEVMKGKHTHYLWLQSYSDENTSFDTRMVDLSRVFLLPKEYVYNLAKSQGIHMRLNSPYREYLSHSFGSFFSRVAINLPKKPLANSTG